SRATAPSTIGSAAITASVFVSGSDKGRVARCCCTAKPHFGVRPAADLFWLSIRKVGSKGGRAWHSAQPIVFIGTSRIPSTGLRHRIAQAMRCRHHPTLCSTRPRGHLLVIRAAPWEDRECLWRLIVVRLSWTQVIKLHAVHCRCLPSRPCSVVRARRRTIPRGRRPWRRLR